MQFAVGSANQLTRKGYTFALFGVSQYQRQRQRMAYPNPYFHNFSLYQGQTCVHCSFFYFFRCQLCCL